MYSEITYDRSYYKLKRNLKKREHKYYHHLDSIPKHVSIYFGVPGSGKTTFAAYLAKKDLKHGIKVYSNVPITGTLQIEPKEDIGINWMSDGRLLIDEAGIEYNNRDFKKFNENALYFYKYHRHYNLAVDIFSQGYDDMDKKIRTLAQDLYVVSKSLLPFFIKRKTIKKRVGINEVSKEIIDEYYFRPFSTKLIFAPAVWGTFNTLSRKDLPYKDFKEW